MKIHAFVLPIVAAIALGSGATASLAQWCCDDHWGCAYDRDRVPSYMDWDEGGWHHAHHWHGHHWDGWCEDECGDHEDVVVSGFWPFCEHVTIHHYHHHHGPPPWWREEREEHRERTQTAPAAPAPEEAQPVPPAPVVHKKPEG